MAGEAMEIGPSGASKRYDLAFQTRITSYFAYRFAERDIVINWRSRGDIYDGRMAPVATVLPGLSDVGHCHDTQIVRLCPRRNAHSSIRLTLFVPFRFRQINSDS